MFNLHLQVYDEMLVRYQKLEELITSESEAREWFANVRRLISGWGWGRVTYG